MAENKKEGVSVKEIEQFAKRHRFEVFFCLVFVLTCIFGVMGHFGPGWSIFLAMVGGVLGILLPMKVGALLEKTVHFVFRQDTTVQLVFAVVGLILSIFLPFVIFLFVGTVAGRGIHHMVSTALPKS